MKKTITIDGIVYVPESEVKTQKAEDLNGMPYVIVRTYSAGCFAGYLAKRKGKEATVKNARRLWYWSGAASLSQLAVDGTSDPSNCKFPCEVPTVDLTEVIEILETTEKAKESINSVKIWEK
jgi:hypothetical protein